MNLNKWYKFFEMRSDAGMGLLLYNILALLWFCVVTGKHLPEGTASIIGIIFTAKTTHGVMTYRKDNANEQTTEETQSASGASGQS